MTDKPLAQQDLSFSIASLMGTMKSKANGILYFEIFWVTISREWNHIDRHRLDKFYFLIKMMLKEAFKFLDVNGWSNDLLDSINEIWIENVFNLSGFMEMHCER